MRIDPADIVFSIYIRTRDGRCVRCDNVMRYNDQGKPNAFTCSHYFGRRNEVTRFDLDNCDTLCKGCHGYYEEHNKKAYTDFKREQLGEERFDELVLRGNATMKQLGMRKDRKLAEMYWKQRLLEDYGVKV